MYVAFSRLFWLWLQGAHVGADAAGGGAGRQVLLQTVRTMIPNIKGRDLAHHALGAPVPPVQEGDVSDHPRPILIPSVQPGLGTGQGPGGGAVQHLQSGLHAVFVQT